MRGKGEGEIRQRSDGRWEGRIDLGSRLVDGRLKRVRRSVYGDTKRAALDELARLRLEFGRTIGDPGMRLNEWFTTHLEVVRATRRYKTYTSYSETVERYLRPNLGNVKMVDVRPSTMWALQAALKASKVPAPTQWYACTVFKIFVRAAAAKEIIPTDPFSAIRLEKPKPKKWKPWTVADARAFFAASKDDPLYPAFVLAATVGLRHGEFLALRPSDFDFGAKTLSVAQQVVEVRVPTPEGPNKWRTEYMFAPVKSEASEAVLSVPEGTLQVLKAHIAEKMVGRGALLFTTSNGTPYLQSNVRRAFDSAIRRAGVPRIRVHDLRHTCATLLLEAGKTLKEIQFLLRHANFNVTANTYAEVTDNMARGLAETMDGIFKGGVK